MTQVTELTIAGMTCGNCARHVTDALRSVPGVQHVAVALETQHATVRWSGPPNVETLIAAVRKAGYDAAPLEEHAHGEEDHSQAKLWGVNVLTGVLPTVFLMAGEWIFGWQQQAWFRWAGFVLALMVQAGPGADFYRGAWRQLKKRSSNMDTLVALGSTTAFAYSAWLLFTGSPGHLYFMEAAAIITIVGVGHWLEARVSLRASSALRGLLKLAPATARRLGDGGESEVPASKLAVGDRILLRPGDAIPTDAEAIEGASAVDESMLTGESLPVEKKPGDKLYAGTANLNGRLIARVTAMGEQTALAHIIAAVERAQTSRANIQRLADKVSSVFVPIVIVIAIGAALWWGFAPDHARAVHGWLASFLWQTHGAQSAFIIAAAVLIIACPCAMGLATPAAIMAGANVAARRGILIRDAIALEKAGQITAVVFDKTGTLTVGKPEVVEVQSFDGSDVRALAAAIARPSNHPLSQAIARLSPAEVALENWQEVRGSGVGAKAGGEHVRLGSLIWLRENGVDVQAAPPAALGLAKGKRLLAAVTVRDTLKPGVREIVRSLERAGLKVYLVTGDNSQTAQLIAREVGIPEDRVFAEVRPERKAELVRKLQEHEKVAFIGDGINDAPALEQADLGIAVARASDIAREAADMILLKSDIQAVPESLGLARATLRTIKQNLFWAFFYNALGVPLAALGFMSPVLCAAAMGLSDLVVIGNALRLHRWRF